MFACGLVRTTSTGTRTRPGVPATTRRPLGTSRSTVYGVLVAAGLVTECLQQQYTTFYL
jgi:hypothetical protein